MFTTLYNWIMTHLVPLVSTIVLGVIGLWAGWALGRLVDRKLRKKTSVQVSILTGRLIRYLIFALVILMLLRQFGFKVGALLGAAGVAGVAIGFASQTSLSNLISGFFLIFENPFKIGDLVEVDSVLGTVDNIALLSTFIRTFDNRLVRIPNEMMIKTRTINLTRFPIRRLDLPVGVAYKHDPESIIALLQEIAVNNTLCLDEPEPLVMFKGFGASALDFMLCVWVEKSSFLAARNKLLTDIKQRFDADGIEIPFPHLSLYTGSVTTPFPIRMVGETDHQNEPSSK